MLSALTAISLACLSLTGSIQIFDGFSVNLVGVIILLLVLSLASLVLSLVALARTRRSRQPHSQFSPPAPNSFPAPAAALPAGRKTLTSSPDQGSSVTDTALIAVLTAAVSMMLEEAAPARTAHTIKTGFTIRKVRRV